MNYSNLLNKLYQSDFERVEKDDRLLDVFTKETREKGVELWIKQSEDQVMILRVRLPFDSKKMQLYSTPSANIEKLLLDNKKADLASYTKKDFNRL